MSRSADSAFATTTMGGRDPFMPKPPKVRGRAITLAVIAHVLLIMAIAFGVNWHSSEPATVAAELWSATPQQAAPRAAEPPPRPAPEPKQAEPAPAPKPEPAPPPPKPALPDPQIALEKAKREEARRVAAEQEQDRKEREKEKARRDKAERDKADREQRAKDEQLAQKKAAAEREKADKVEKAETARLAAARDQQMKRVLGLAGASGGPTDTGTALRSSAPSDAYGGRIAARIKPNIVFTEPIEGNPRAEVELRLAPDGSIAGKRLVKSSGVKAWDDAVLRAIERTETFPLDSGRVPPPIVIGFRPRD